MTLRLNTFLTILIQVYLETLLQLHNGKNALNLYNTTRSSSSVGDSQASGSEAMVRSGRAKRTRNKVTMKDFVNSFTAPIDSEEDTSDDGSTTKKRRIAKDRSSIVTGTRHSSRVGSIRGGRAASGVMLDEDSSSSDDMPLKRRGGGSSNRNGAARIRSSGRTTRAGIARPIMKLTNKPGRFDEDELDELAGEGISESGQSAIVYIQKKTSKRLVKERNRERSMRSQPNARKVRQRQESSSSSSERPQPSRRSGRDRGAAKSMRERDMEEEIYADEVVKSNAPKVISIREIFQPLPKQSKFRIAHNDECDVCGQSGTHSNKGTSPLVHCQGCSTSIHKVCLGYRSGREHMVTKVGHEDFVMQCRRCIGIATKKDSSAPRLDQCQVCRIKGRACAAFSPKRTAKQEERLREENSGDDPVTVVAPELLNNAQNVLFRCGACRRCYHFEHLPPLNGKVNDPEDLEKLREVRIREYRAAWQCLECREMDANSAKVQGLVAWRPANPKTYTQGHTVDQLREDEKDYLIRWEGKSYFKCTWMPGSWVWGITSVAMRNAFIRRDEGANLLPKWTNEEAIPEEFLRMEIIFDVQYEDGFRLRSEKSDRARIDHVDQVYVKFLGLTYEDAVWEEPPKPEDEARWSDYVAAYNEFVAGRYFKQLSASTMVERTEDFRTLNFEKKVELKKQPSALTGGEMMPYQMEGLNWLLYNFHRKKNVILADEMGLGKTIQIISLFATLIKDNPKVKLFPIYGVKLANDFSAGHFSL